MSGETAGLPGPWAVTPTVAYYWFDPSIAHHYNPRNCWALTQGACQVRATTAADSVQHVAVQTERPDRVR
jgi:hypothetical protein